MKKIFSIIICCVLAFSLVGCGKDDATKMNGNDTNNAIIGGADEPTDIVVSNETDSQNETGVSGEELVEMIERLEEIEDPEERKALLAEIQVILDQAENTLE